MMKKNYLILFLLFVIFIPVQAYTVSLNMIPNVEIIFDSIDNNYDIPEESGQVKNMPWRNDKNFLEAKEKYETPILISAFCAVLNNPLPGEEHNVARAASSIKGKLVKPGDIFSQNQSIGPYTVERGYEFGSTYIAGKVVMTEGGGVCKITTSLYNLAVLSDLDIVERHCHSMPINYVPYGQDATVAFGIKDFKFKNTTEDNILIWSQLIGNRLYMGFYGSSHAPKVEWTHEISNVVEHSTQYVKNEELPKGESLVKIIGLDGASVQSHVTVSYRDGHIAYKKMQPSYYLPLPEVIETN